jgi:hypothetical protein
MTETTGKQLGDAVASLIENESFLDNYIESDDQTDVTTPDGTIMPSFQKRNAQLIADTNAQVSAVISNLSQREIDVMAYGVTNDGVTDNSAALQSLFNDRGPGNTYIFPRGTYYLGSRVANIPERTTILGEGPEDTIFRPAFRQNDYPGTPGAWWGVCFGGYPDTGSDPRIPGVSIRGVGMQSQSAPPEWQSGQAYVAGQYVGFNHIATIGGKTDNTARDWYVRVEVNHTSTDFAADLAAGRLVVDDTFWKNSLLWGRYYDDFSAEDIQTDALGIKLWESDNTRMERIRRRHSGGVEYQTDAHLVSYAGGSNHELVNIDSQGNTEVIDFGRVNGASARIIRGARQTTMVETDEAIDTGGSNRVLVEDFELDGFIRAFNIKKEYGGGNNITLRNGTIDCTSQSGSIAVLVNGGMDTILVDNVQAKNAAKSMRLTASAGETVAGVTVRDCNFSAPNLAGSIGFEVFSTSSSTRGDLEGFTIENTNIDTDGFCYRGLFGRDFVANGGRWRSRSADVILPSVRWSGRSVYDAPKFSNWHLRADNGYIINTADYELSGTPWNAVNFHLSLIGCAPDERSAYGLNLVRPSLFLSVQGGNGWRDLPHNWAGPFNKSFTGSFLPVFDDPIWSDKVLTVLDLSRDATWPTQAASVPASATLVDTYGGPSDWRTASNVGTGVTYDAASRSIQLRNTGTTLKVLLGADTGAGTLGAALGGTQTPFWVALTFRLPGTGTAATSTLARLGELEVRTFGATTLGIRHEADGNSITPSGWTANAWQQLFAYVEPELGRIYIYQNGANVPDGITGDPYSERSAWTWAATDEAQIVAGSGMTDIDIGRLVVGKGTLPNPSIYATREHAHSNSIWS